MQHGRARRHTDTHRYLITPAARFRLALAGADNDADPAASAPLRPRRGGAGGWSLGPAEVGRRAGRAVLIDSQGLGSRTRIIDSEQRLDSGIRVGDSDERIG